MMRPIKDQGVTLCETHIGDNVWIGAKATVLCGLTLGSGVVVGANAVVTKDVPAYAMVAGVPARVIGYMCERGERLAFDAEGKAMTSYGQVYQRSRAGVVAKVQA